MLGSYKQLVEIRTLHHFLNAMRMQMPEKAKMDVILTKVDGTQIVYHTNRRDALHQMLLGVGVLSTDR